MKKFFNPSFFITLFFTGFGILSFGQSYVGQPLGSSIILDPDGGGGPPCLNTSAQLTIFIANLDNFEPLSQNGNEFLPERHPLMYLKYSIEGNPHQIVPLTTFNYYDQVNGVNLYSASIQTASIDFCDECNNTEDAVYLDYTMEIVTPDPESPLGSNIYIPYPACEHSDEDDIFSCTVFTYATDCLAGTCNNYALTYSAGQLHVCNEELPVLETEPNGNTRSNVNNNDQTITDEKENIQQNQNDISVRPNPFSDHLEMQWSEHTEISNVFLHDINGKLIQSWTQNQISLNTTFYIHTDHLAKGLYFIKVESTTSTEVIKVIKQ